MPDPDPKTIFLNLTLENALLVLVALNSALKNPRNTQHYNLKVGDLAKHLYQLILDRWPVFHNGPITDLIQHDLYPDQRPK